ncbi:unknown similar to AMEV168 [Mythimna separata entomopoxvirus 'L']|uniref:Uncharacterized protein n=1 Tax=Mythimna separata entomopoxvirus 'L' TaxID=1293572 RepID=A0A916KQD8_9POXV|nr:unknown similar to AMEV168 [Mythimna separata entomopoxvirus 'L']CCU56405.1 unknown similar to AMEV168 [Mythimna separata entomopoxvirus 'L']
MNYIILAVIFVIIIIFFYYSIRVINRDTYELETDETENIAKEFVNNINDLKNTDLINKYISDMKLETRIQQLESEIEALKERKTKRVKEITTTEESSTDVEEEVVENALEPEKEILVTKTTKKRNKKILLEE